MNFITFKMPMFKTTHVVVTFAMALLIDFKFCGAQASPFGEDGYNNRHTHNVGIREAAWKAQVPMQPHLDFCGSGTYNVTTQICCSGRAVLRGSHGGYECCGHHSYNPENQVCCFGKVHPIGHGKCCVGLRQNFSEYQPVKQSCCNSVVSAIPEITGIQECCGGVAYLTSSQMCCNGNLSYRGEDLECCGSGTYNRSTDLCCNDKIIPRLNPNHQCCGSTSFDPSTETCCGGKVPPKAEKCCRLSMDTFEVFNEQMQTCCGIMDWNAMLYTGKIHNVPASSTTCCGDQLLEFNQLCYNNIPIERSNPGHNEICRYYSNNELMYSTFNKEEAYCNISSGVTAIPPGHELCGRNTYNPETHLCCNEHVIDHRADADTTCCGFNAYDKTLQSCLLGNVFDIPQEYAGNCQDKAFDTRNYMCDVNSEIRPIRQDQIVCDGIVYQASSGGTCCGKSLIDPESHVCCDGIPNSREREDTKCCGKLSYDNLTQTCCGESLYNHSNRACCGSLYYDTTDQVCHESMGQFYVFRKEDEGMLCREGSYDASIHTCCQGFLHKHIARGECCGNKVVRNANEEVCCGGELKQKKQGHTECCGGQMFNPDMHQCCGGKKLPRYSDYRQCCNDRIILALQECAAS